jgi:hypothetical protein
MARRTVQRVIRLREQARLSFTALVTYNDCAGTAASLPKMQHKPTAFPWRATISLALLALCIGLDPGRGAEHFAQSSGIADSQSENLDGPPAKATTPAVSQQAVLFEEDPAAGENFFGLVAWRTELLPAGAAKQEPAVHAQITIPERLVASLTLRRNTDQNLHASHVIEVTFKIPPGSANSPIGSVPGILMKTSLHAKGAPLAGIAEKISNASFLIGLSAANPQAQNNLELMKDRDWLDVLIVYDTGRRAVLAMQKGPSGDRVFAEAFSAWQQ